MNQAYLATPYPFYPKIQVLGEPQLGKRGLYPTISAKGSANEARTMMNLISYCDGNHTLLKIAKILGTPIWELHPIVQKLTDHQLLHLQPVPSEARNAD